MDAAAPPTVMTEDYAQPQAASSSEPEAHTVDLGVGTFLRSGIASGGVLGLSPFVTDDLGRGVFLRIAASVGQSPASSLRLTWVAGRLDTCAETLGNYPVGSGLRFDLCGGADVGESFIAPAAGRAAQSLPFVDVGPSVDLRAELGTRAALLLRAAAGINIARDLFVDATGATYQPALATVQLEVALSWTFGGGPSGTLIAAATSPSR
jgi:hypothetical protein